MDDLLLQILLLLPVISLLRFKSVSKRWLSLIMDPMILNRVPDPVLGIIRTRFDLEYFPLFPNKYVLNKNNLFPTGLFNSGKILHSCNGLLLCLSLPSPQYFVYNPTTHGLTMIPRLLTLDHPYGSTLVFDPIISPTYTIILACGGGRIRSYSSNTRKWRLHTRRIEKDDLIIKNGVYWNGSVHWISDKAGESAVRFHVESEAVHEMIPPPLVEGQYSDVRGNCYFGETLGHLHYMEPDWLDMLHIFEMKDDYSEWFVRYQVDLSPVRCELMADKHNLRYNHLFLLSFVSRKEDKESILVLWVPWRVIECNIVDMTLKTTHDAGLDGGGLIFFRGNRFDYARGFHFIPSLCDTQ